MKYYIVYVVRNPIISCLRFARKSFSLQRTICQILFCSLSGLKTSQRIALIAKRNYTHGSTSALAMEKSGVLVNGFRGGSHSRGFPRCFLSSSLCWWSFQEGRVLASQSVFSLLCLQSFLVWLLSSALAHAEFVVFLVIIQQITLSPAIQRKQPRIPRLGFTNSGLL